MNILQFRGLDLLRPEKRHKTTMDVNNVQVRICVLTPRDVDATVLGPLQRLVYSEEQSRCVVQWQLENPSKWQPCRREACPRQTI